MNEFLPSFIEAPIKTSVPDKTGDELQRQPARFQPLIKPLLPELLVRFTAPAGVDQPVGHGYLQCNGAGSSVRAGLSRIYCFIPCPWHRIRLCSLEMPVEWTNKRHCSAFRPLHRSAPSGLSIFSIWKPSPEQLFSSHLMKTWRLGLPVLRFPFWLQRSSEPHVKSIFQLRRHLWCSVYQSLCS